jgi:hypothetical protein
VRDVVVTVLHHLLPAIFGRVCRSVLDDSIEHFGGERVRIKITSF